jgi:hypothetical protein
MLTPDDIVNQQEFLAIYRRNLDHLLEQAAQYGGEQFAPVQTMNSIAEARANIARIKAILRAAGVAVADKPDDAEPSILPPQTSPAPLPESPQIQAEVRESPHTSYGALTAPSPGAAETPAQASPATRPTPTPAAALLVSNTAGRSTQAQVAVDHAGVVYVAWLDNTPRQGRGETVLCRKRTPDGVWSQIEDLTPDLEYIVASYLTVNLKRRVCLVVHSLLGIFTRCLEDGGWSPLANEGAAATRDVFAPACDADGRVRWISGLNEVTFGDHKLDDGLAGPLAEQFVIDVDGVYHVVWQRTGQVGSIEHRLSRDAGHSWQQQQRLTSDDASFAANPSLVADTQGAVHLVWHETGAMRYRQWTGSHQWSETTTIASQKAQGLVSLAVTPQGRPAVVWACDCTIFYASQSDGGAWGGARALNGQSSPSNCAQEPRIAIDDAGVRHVVWIAPGNVAQPDVFYANLPAEE